jgi:hypothetical protein
MKQCKYVFLLPFFLLVIATGCGCNDSIPSPTDLFAMQDSTPPVLLSCSAVNQTTLCFYFDEPIEKNSVTLAIDKRSTNAFVCNGKSLTVSLSKSMPLASYCTVDGRVEDERGNSCRFTTNIWAKNTNRANALINEFTTKGTENNPDRVELLITKGGNLAGLTLANGIGSNYKDRCILPDKLVTQGEYIVIAFQTGKESVAYHSEKLEGLSSNNGCLVLSETPAFDSLLLDAVLYGNHTTTTYEGFGSNDLLQSAEYLVQYSQWDTKLEQGCIDSTYGTSTRSLCREKAKDSNSSLEWYVVDTKQSTFGARNSEQRYETEE